VNRLLVRLSPVWITLLVIGGVCMGHAWSRYSAGASWIGRLEGWALDARAARAAARPHPVASDLGMVYLDEDSLADLSQAGGYRWPLPRQIHGWVIRELKAQGARVIGLDLFFFDRDRDYAENRVGNLSSDEFFAREMAAAGNVVLATSAQDVSNGAIRLQPLPPLFSQSAAALGHDGIRGLSAAGDGALRRVPAFVDDPDLGRVWHMGIVLAARALDLDLDGAIVESGRITLRSPRGDTRVIPVDRSRRLYIDWAIGTEEDRIEKARYSWVYAAARERERQPGLPSRWRGKVVLIGSAGIGSNLSDWGATPVGRQTPLCLSHLNVANSIILNRFILRAPLAVELALIVFLGGISALLGWRFRAPWALAGTLGLMLGYGFLAVWLYERYRWWLPMVLPLAGSVLMTYICWFSYRLIRERMDRREMHRRFGRMVSPNVFNLLVHEGGSALGGSRREVTVYFADVRGFTRFVEERHERNLVQLRQRQLTGAAAESVIDQEARETLATVNLYLGRVADIVKAYDGTLDKYIGDCVMSFWGAPLACPNHALRCVKAALAVHKSIHALNQLRLAENRRRESENAQRDASHQPLLESLPILKIGSAIHSGVATVGFMGSEAHVSNFTVFGRDVNIASRIERVVGPDCIYVSEATWQAVRRDAPELAATFLQLAPMMLESIAEPLGMYEVPWQSTFANIESAPA